MDNLKLYLIDLISSKPKHYGIIVKKDREILEKLGNSHLPIPERVYLYLNPTVNTICSNNKRYKFKSITEGYGFCGKTTTCLCAKESVSVSVSDSKKKLTVAEKERINKKRKQTNLEKYGVENVGQTSKAKQRHLEFYSNPANKEKAISHYRETMLREYNVDNPSKLPEVKEKRKNTLMTKYGVSNPMQDREICQRSLAKRKESFDPLNDIENRYIKFRKMLLNRFGVIPNLTAEQYTGVAIRPEIEFTCVNCNHTFVKRFDYAVPPICKNCYPTGVSYQSKEEVAVFNYVKDLLPESIVIQRDRSIINPYELDIVIPELKIAIEYCGLYWHSEVSGHKTWDYHYTKHRLCDNKGYQLITIFSDEWNSKNDIVKSKIASIIGKSTDKVYARQCTIKEVDRKDAILFYDRYHIQGSRKRLGKSIGLYNNGELVAVSSFLDLPNRSCELVRYASSIQVVGGLSKILKYIERAGMYDRIISFSDNRWSKGGVYLSCGFTQIGLVPPMQQYVKDDTRYHKLLFPKKRINPSNLPLTEWQMMQRLGYDRIWDCGKIKWQLEFNSSLGNAADYVDAITLSNVVFQ